MSLPRMSPIAHETRRSDSFSSLAIRVPTFGSAQVVKGIWRQGIVLKHRSSLQKSQCPVVICPYLCSSDPRYSTSTLETREQEEIHRSQGRIICLIVWFLRMALDSLFHKSMGTSGRNYWAANKNTGRSAKETIPQPLGQAHPLIISLYVLV